MKRILLRISIATSVIFYAVSAQAQPKLSLEEYRKMVLDYNFKLKISGENQTAAAEKFALNSKKLLPSLTASANGSYTFGNEIVLSGMALKDYNWTANLNLQQVIYGGGALSAQKKASGVELKIAQAASEQTLDNVLYSAEVLYWTFVASAEQRDITRQYVGIVAKLYGVVKERFDDGYLSRTDLLMVETRLNEAELQKIAAEKMYLNALQRLNTQIGHPTSRDYFIVDSLNSKNQSLVGYGNQKVVDDEILSQRAEYKISKLKIELQDEYINLAQAPYNPQFVVGVQGIAGTPSLNFSGDTKIYGAAYAGLNIPIFQWGERRNSISMARAAKRSAEYAAEEQADQIDGEISAAIIGLEKSQEQINVAIKNLSAAQNNLELNTFSYNEGRLPILDVLQSQLSWIQSFTALVSSNYEYKVAIVDYKKATGSISQ